MSWPDYLVMVVGGVAVSAFAALLTLWLIHKIVVTWGKATFAVATLQEAMDKASYFHRRCNRLENARPLLVRVEEIVFSEATPEDRIAALGELLSDDGLME